MPLSLVSELSAKVSPRREDKASLNTTETVKLGSMTAIQVETHMLRPMVVLVSTLLPLASELSARDSLKEDLRALLRRALTVLPNTMVTLKHGLMTATQEETHTLRPMVEPVSMPLPLASESSAKDLHRREDRALLNIMVTLRLGLMIAIQEETHMLKLTEVLVLMPQLHQVLELNAKVSPRREDRASLSIMVTPRLGSTTATQEEIHTLKLMEVPVSMPPPQVLVSNAKDLPKREDRALPSITVILKLGLMLATQLEMSQRKLTQVELEHGKMDKRDLIQESALSAKASLRNPQGLLPNSTETEMLGLRTAIPQEMSQLKLTQAVPELTKTPTKAHTQELASNARVFLNKNRPIRTS